MCTVTLVYTEKNDFILTSNRDEAIDRKTLIPEFYRVNDTRMLFPKDIVAGGTWVGVSDKDNLICLLNGGFKCHKRLSSYRKSRGVVVKDLLGAYDLEKALHSYECEGVEPFTIIAVNWTTDLLCMELIWDGSKKHIKLLEKETTHIWSSSTLYTDDMKVMRREWFDTFVKEHLLDSETLLGFHKNAGIGDEHVDLKIDRGMLKTRSITQVVKSGDELVMRYENLQNGAVNSVVFNEELIRTGYE